MVGKEDAEKGGEKGGNGGEKVGENRGEKGEKGAENGGENKGENGVKNGGEKGGTNGDENGGILLSDDPQDIVDKLFVQMDKNQDGKLSMEEFVTSAKTDPTIAKLLQCEEAVRMHGGTPSLTKQE